MSVIGATRRRAIPGEPGLWLFLLADMTVFAVFFASVLVVRSQQPEMFAASSAHLSQALGAVNTLLLLTSSLFVVLAVHGRRRLFDGALLCGLAFIAVKAVEWGGHIGDGLTPSSNDFFGLYYMLTGIHLVHVFVGMGVLLAIRRSPSPAFVEGGACYWHMVDLLWLVLFPLLYLLG